MGRPINKKYFGTLNNPVSAGSFVPGVQYVITTVGSTNFTAIGASANTVGVLFRATGVGSGDGVAELFPPNIPVEAAYIDGEIKRSETGAEVFIVKQKSSRRFLVQAEDGSQAICRLVNKVTDSSAVGQTATGDNEMVIIGYYQGSATAIQKMSNRVAVDFNGNRYAWEVQDDSTTTVLVLTSL